MTAEPLTTLLTRCTPHRRADGTVYSFPSAQVTGTNPHEIANLEMAERKKAPSTITAAFYDDDGAPKEGEGSESQPYEVKAGET